MNTYTETTDGVRITVQPVFLEERSNIANGEFFFVYFVSIENQRPESVTLLRRHWYIKDDGGMDYEVEGEGIVGEKPTIAPGGLHSYNSFCELKSFQGSMEGSYRMQLEDGSAFDVVIPKFYLRARMN
jgi:ApaG protein